MKFNQEKYKNYVHDLGLLLKELGEEALENYNSSMGTDEESYKLGYLMGFHRVLTLMQQNAEGFNIEKGELGMSGFDPDSDLI